MANSGLDLPSNRQMRACRSAMDELDMVTSELSRDTKNDIIVTILNALRESGGCELSFGYRGSFTPAQIETAMKAVTIAVDGELPTGDARAAGVAVLDEVDKMRPLVEPLALHIQCGDSELPELRLMTALCNLLNHFLQHEPGIDRKGVQEACRYAFEAVLERGVGDPDFAEVE